jgi:hypothetical protein
LAAILLQLSAGYCRLLLIAVYLLSAVCCLLSAESKPNKKLLLSAVCCLLNQNLLSAICYLLSAGC